MNQSLQALQPFLNSYAIVLFCKSYCPYSKIAKEAIQANEALFSDYKNNKHLIVIDIDVMFKDCPAKMETLQNDLKTLSGISTVPQLFCYDSSTSRYVGDSTVVKNLQLKNKLAPILRTAIQQFDLHKK